MLNISEYSLSNSKKVIGVLYPRLLDKDGREIDGFHRKEADSEWKTETLEHIDTDVKYWTARIAANAHRRTVSKEERKKEIIELAKALKDEGHEGSLVNVVSELTTFSKRYIRDLLPDEFKREYEEPKSELSANIKQKPKKQTRKVTTDKEKLENLHKKVENSAFAGKSATSNFKLKAEELGLDVNPYGEELEKIKETLQESIGRRYDEVQESLNEAYNKSTEIKKSLTDSINREKERIKRVKEELKEEVTDEVKEELREEIKKETKKKKSKRDQEEKIKISGFESSVEWTDYGINIYDGCYHGCTYCYGKLQNDRFKRLEVWTEPKKRNIDLEDLSRKLKNLPKGSFFFCSTCDAYQPLNRELNWAREVLQVLLDSGHHIIILTKSAYVEDDFDLISQYDNVEVGFTVTSLDDEAYTEYEPNSSTPSEKVRVLRKAQEMGIKTLVSLEPWIIGHTNPVEIINELKYFVDRWIIGVANYMGFELEEYRQFVPELVTYLFENNIQYRFKAELDRVIKSNPILSRKEYEESIMQQVGDQ